MKKTEWKSFIKFPRALIESPEFSDLSVEAKVLLALILDRYGVSEINAERFTDERGIFVIFTINKICENLGCGKTKALQLLRILEDKGLIFRIRGNNCKPSRIYITRLFFDSLKNEPVKREKQTPRGSENKPREVSKAVVNYNNKSNNKFSNNKSSIIGFEKTEDEIREQIEYDCIVCDENRKLLDEIVMIISDVLSGTSPTVRVGRDDMPRGLAVSRFCRLDAEHILYVLSGIGRNTKKINNIKAYLTTMLYNAPATMEAEAAALFARNHG